jgi:DNA-binding NarL/FixJ family response regulator
MATAGLIRVVLVDDHTMIRQGLRTVLQSYSNIEVVGEAGDGEEAVLKVKNLQPSVVVMDIAMPKMDGIAATRLVKTQFPHIAVLGLSVTAKSYQVDAMLKAGAFEIVTKEKAVDELYGAIQKAVAAVQPILILKEAPALAKPATDSEDLQHPHSTQTDPLPLKGSDS